MNNLTNFFRLVSDETRLRLLMILSEKELCVCELCHILSLSQPKVSRHLARLRDMGLVQTKREGQWIFYDLKLEDPLIRDIIKLIKDNMAKYDLLRKDWERLNVLIQDNKLCERVETTDSVEKSMEIRDTELEG